MFQATVGWAHLPWISMCTTAGAAFSTTSAMKLYFIRGESQGSAALTWPGFNLWCKHHAPKMIDPEAPHQSKGSHPLLCLKCVLPDNLEKWTFCKVNLWFICGLLRRKTWKTEENLHEKDLTMGAAIFLCHWKMIASQISFLHWGSKGLACSKHFQSNRLFLSLHDSREKQSCVVSLKDANLVEVYFTYQ